MANTIRFIKNHKIIILLLFFGLLINLSFYLPIKNSTGHDVFWHLALIENAFYSIPPSLPIMSGRNLLGYNWLLDFLMFFVTKFGFSGHVVYAFIFPVFFTLALAILIINLCKKQKKTAVYCYFLLFFAFFASPFSYILSWIKRGSIFFGFNHPTAMQSATSMTNPQYAATILLILFVLIILENKKLALKQQLIIYFCVFLAFGFKFYGGIILAIVIFLHNSLQLIKNKTLLIYIKSLFMLALSTFISIVVFYDPFSASKTGAIFTLSPLSIVHPIIEDPDSFYMPNLVLARYYLYENNIFSPRLWFIEIFTILFYFLYNAGTRIIGGVYIINSVLKKSLNRFEIIIFSTSFIGFMLTISLIQKGEWWNTVQFFGYSLFFLNFFAASFAERIYQFNKKIKYLFILIIVLLTLPLSIELLMLQTKRFYAPEAISKNEQQALSFLKKQPKNTVLQLPISDSAYVSALTSKPLYFADEQVLKNIGINYQKRKDNIENIINLNIKKLPVKYIYINKTNKESSAIIDKLKNNDSTKKIFDNSEIIIYKYK